jgi:LmbE family N-acetylglucosaminyl deacetylase
MPKPILTVRISMQRLENFAKARVFAKIYAGLSVAVLLLSTIFWAILGSRLQQSNSDQLINSYLFDNANTFHNALFPSAHTFLIKWPLFLFLRNFNFSGAALQVFTVSIVVITVAALAAIIYKIERRPLVFGTLFLFLASTLLLVPAVPAPGNLLPVNMAMLATRNFEYILFILSIGLIVAYTSFRSWRFWLGIILLSLLVASDKLFLSLAAGGALLALIVYALTSGWRLVTLSVRWLVASVISAALAALILAGVNNAHITHITNQAGLGPYGVITSAHNLFTAAAYGVSGVLTNFGANPALNTTLLRQMPSAAAHNFLGWAGLAFLVNLAVLIYGLYCSAKLIIHSLKYNRDKSVIIDLPQKLALALSWSAIAAFGIFIISNHYYAGDARYLSIWLFSIFIVTATHSRWLNISAAKLSLAGLVCLVGILLAVPAVINSYSRDEAALAPYNARNKLVVETLLSHKVDSLVGDYWRVIPIRSVARSRINVLPLSGCTVSRDVLSSKAWQIDLKSHSFAYLLSLNRGLTDYPGCTLNQVVQSFGRPNSSIVLNGSVTHPTEALLFYDHGAHKSEPRQPAPASGPATVVPVSLDEAPNTNCNVPTLMNIVAHEDDDLLFMNPDTLHSIQAGHCVRTVYVTAGDSGAGTFYWLDRLRGSEAAYSKMLAEPNGLWVERIVKISDNSYVTIASPRDNPRISLIFMYLPDGNLRGQGFGLTGDQSLSKLESHRIAKIDTVYTGSSYSQDQLAASLSALMHAYDPSEIHTQANYVSTKYPDHSDHIAVGQIVKQAYARYEQEQFENSVNVPLSYYIGYPIHEFPANVSDGDLIAKEAIFNEYSKFDGGVCHSNAQCTKDPAYGAYLPREYQNAQ